MTTSMETLSQAMRRLDDDGWTVEFTAVDDRSGNGALRCPRCSREFEPGRADVHEQLRFEGTSDPDDMSILFALACPCGARGLYTAMFGPEMAPEDALVVRHLPR